MATEREIYEFWARNKTPVGLMVQRARQHGVSEQQVEAAARIVFEEVKDIIENVPEIKLYMNGKELERVILFRNMLKPNILGWRVFEVAKSVKAYKYITALQRIEQLEKELQKKSIWSRIKSFKWEIDPWQ